MRHQLPAWSPLTLRAVVAAAAGLAGAADTRARLAAALSGRCGAREALLTDSGTGALALAIRGALAHRPGASVALPAYGCYDLATAADGAEAPVVLYDLDPATLAPEAASLERALARGAGAVVLVHLYGIPVDPAPFEASCRAAGAVVIEDAAQGAGGSLRGLPLGSFGDLTVLSFGRGKGNTAGKGGALLARTDAGAAAVDAVRARVRPPAQGLAEVVQLKAQWLLGTPSLYAVPASLPFLHLGETRYHAPAPVAALSDAAAGALAVTLPLGEREAEVRRAHAARWIAACRGDVRPVRVPAGGEAGYLRFPVVVPPARRARAEGAEARRLGIMPGYPGALCDLGGFAPRVRNPGEPCAGARELARCLVTLPTHSRLGAGDLERIDAWMTRWGHD